MENKYRCGGSACRTGICRADPFPAANMAGNWNRPDWGTFGVNRRGERHATRLRTRVYHVRRNRPPDNSALRVAETEPRPAAWRIEERPAGAVSAAIAAPVQRGSGPRAGA